MIQELWIFDFLILLILRLILGLSFIREWGDKKNNLKDNLFAIIFLTSALLIILGYFTSFVSFFLLIYDLIKIVKSIIIKSFRLENLYRFILLLVLLFIGPGELSFDYFLNVRF